MIFRSRSSIKGSGGHPASTANGAHSWHGVSGNTIGVGGSVVDVVVELVDVGAGALLVEVVVKLVDVVGTVTSSGGAPQAKRAP